jgi:excisionase family DNA binding protein
MVPRGVPALGAGADPESFGVMQSYIPMEVPMRTIHTVPEFAQIFKLNEQRAYDLIRRGVIPAIKLGRQLRVTEEAIENFITSGGAAVLPEGPPRKARVKKDQRHRPVKGGAGVGS